MKKMLILFVESPHMHPNFREGDLSKPEVWKHIHSLVMSVQQGKFCLSADKLQVSLNRTEKGSIDMYIGGYQA
jgi:hypothetical protein